MANMSVGIARKRDPYTKVKMFLLERNIPQHRFAAAIGVGVRAINQKLNGTGSDFSLNEVRTLCSEFGIPKEYFFEISVPKKEHKGG